MTIPLECRVTSECLVWLNTQFAKLLIISSLPTRFRTLPDRWLVARPKSFWTASLVYVSIRREKTGFTSFLFELLVNSFLMTRTFFRNKQLDIQQAFLNKDKLQSTAIRLVKIKGKAEF